MPTLQKTPKLSQAPGMDSESPSLQHTPHPAPQAAMEPPAYTPPSPNRPYRSIQDLRAQIVANGSVIRPRSDVHRSSDDHIELIVAKTPAPRIVSSSPRGFGNSNPQTHWTEKEAMAAFNRASDPMRGTATAVGGGAGPGMGGIGEKHYALLMRRSGGNSKTVYIIVQGEPRDTVEEALEWMLERTECMMHDIVVRHGRPDPGDTCTVM